MEPPSLRVLQAQDNDAGADQDQRRGFAGGVLADQRAVAWLQNWTDGRRQEAVDAGTVARLRDLREGLRQLAAANNRQRHDEEIADRAAAVLRSVPLVVEFGGPETPPRLGPYSAAGLAERALADAAGSYLTAAASGEWSRVKACAAPDCRWAYLDSSRNRSRRWCDMAECGNRAKNRAWRQRQAVGG
ncbi:CGNR zinc finger domain-containing protein [Nonomuraea sp. 3N208]|uniref:CGNR zinc finger domain-containing protein n=1 Tax=Nonomuraea sp. 3N208 TaxID=3457421 RepID=UPI003FCFD1EA